MTEFTSRAARALLAAINSVNRVEAPADEWWFPCLTYPEKFPAPREAKRHFEAFRERFRRAWADVSGLWKMEPQERLAPHFHCLLRIPPGVEPNVVHSWWARTWYDVAGGGDVKHLVWHMHRRAFEKMRTWDGVGSYAAKYMGKRIADQGWDKPGRLWGKLNWAAMPVRPRDAALTRPEAVRLKRSMLRWLDHQKTGRYRIDAGPGRVDRAWLRPREVEQRRERGQVVRPYHRRRRRRATGGCEMLIPAAVTEQLLGHALGDVPLSRFAEAFKHLGGSSCNGK